MLLYVRRGIVFHRKLDCDSCGSERSACWHIRIRSAVHDAGERLDSSSQQCPSLLFWFHLVARGGPICPRVFCVRFASQSEGVCYNPLLGRVSYVLFLGKTLCAAPGRLHQNVGSWAWLPK